jgi:hypothetical protein
VVQYTISLCGRPGVAASNGLKCSDIYLFPDAGDGGSFGTPDSDSECEGTVKKCAVEKCSDRCTR